MKFIELRAVPVSWKVYVGELQRVFLKFMQFIVPFFMIFRVSRSQVWF